jgi:hypothetical protein
MLSRDLVDMPDHGADRGPREAATVWEAAARSYSVSWVCISLRRAIPAKTVIRVHRGASGILGLPLGSTATKWPKGRQTNPRAPLGRTGLPWAGAGQKAWEGKIAPAATSGIGLLSGAAWCSHTVITIRPTPLHKTFPVYLSNLLSLLPLSSYLLSPLVTSLILWFLRLACGSF